MKISIINGPNLNMLGIREPNLYGNKTYTDLVDEIFAFAQKNNVEVEIFQSNCEGEIVDQIQNAYFRGFDAIIINAGAYTHTSIAILDALKAVSLPCVEVHLTDINNRDEFRKKSFVSLVAEKQIVGKGIQGYILAIEYLLGLKN